MNIENLINFFPSIFFVLPIFSIVLIIALTIVYLFILRIKKIKVADNEIIEISDKDGVKCLVLCILSIFAFLFLLSPHRLYAGLYKSVIKRLISLIIFSIIFIYANIIIVDEIQFIAIADEIQYRGGSGFIFIILLAPSILAIYFLTLIIFSFSVADLILIINGEFTDSEGKYIRIKK